MIAVILLLSAVVESPMDKMPPIPVSSSDQRGGVTAGSIATLNYYSLPPVTEQERAIAAERLKLTLEDVATYDQRPSDLGRETVLEQVRTEKVARRLYITLSSFFDPTILSLAEGKKLLSFKREYSEFSSREGRLEQQALEYFGTSGDGQSQLSWETLLRYAVLRAYRGSKEAVKASGMTFFEVGPDQAEVAYLKFVADKNGGAWLIPNAQQQEKMIADAQHLLAPYNRR